MLASWRNENQHTIPMAELERQLNAAQAQELLCTSPEQKSKEPKDIITILTTTKKELDELLASGSSDLSFTFEEGGGEVVFRLPLFQPFRSPSGAAVWLATSITPLWGFTELVIYLRNLNK